MRRGTRASNVIRAAVLLICVLCETVREQSGDCSHPYPESVADPAALDRIVM